jgi:hypothetical protein
VGPEEEGVWEISPQPSLLADDSRPRQIRVFAVTCQFGLFSDGLVFRSQGLERGEGFLRGIEEDACTILEVDKGQAVDFPPRYS